jgi:Domain of unknown function (DUF892)
VAARLPGCGHVGFFVAPVSARELIAAKSELLDEGDRPMELDLLAGPYADELKNIHSAPITQIRAFPKMVKAAWAPKLSEALATYLKQMHAHERPLEKKSLEELGDTSNPSRER